SPSRTASAWKASYSRRRTRLPSWESRTQPSNAAYPPQLGSASCARSACGSMGVRVKRNTGLGLAARAWSTTGDRRNEYHRIALGERCRPLAELGVDRDPQHLRRERERVARGELGVQLARRARGGHQRLLAPPGLLAQQRVVLHGDVPGG